MKGKETIIIYPNELNRYMYILQCLWLVPMGALKASFAQLSGGVLCTYCEPCCAQNQGVIINVQL